MWRQFTHVIHDTRDVNEHAASLSMWDQQYEQLSAGPFQGRVEELRIGPAQLFREQTQQAVWQHGLSRPGTVALAVPLAMASESWYCGQRLASGQGFAVRAGAEFELITHGPFDVVALDVDQDFLRDYARRVDGVDLPDDWQPATVSGCGGTLQVTTLREMLLTTLQTAREMPALLAHEPMRRALVHAACDVLLARLPESDACPVPTLPTRSTRRQLVQEARAYMRQHIDEPIGVPDLCEALQVSRRTLQYSFQDVLQLSPVTCLRVLRLNGLRRELLRGDRQTSVADCAARWGFWHLPRLAADYRALFGELPSATLQRAREGRAAPH
jgi:AraC family transcriptional regulator, ethanolamine operon transcriptional activator